jgi:hypothetical protein
MSVQSLREGFATMATPFWMIRQAAGLLRHGQRLGMGRVDDPTSTANALDAVEESLRSAVVGRAWIFAKPL